MGPDAAGTPEASPMGRADRRVFRASFFPQTSLVHTYSMGIVDQTQHEPDGLTSNQRLTDRRRIGVLVRCV